MTRYTACRGALQEAAGPAWASLGCCAAVPLWPTLPLPHTPTHPPTHPPLQDLADVLSAIPYCDNDVWLHSDAALMPRSRKTWASWNFLGKSGQQGDK